MVSTPLIPEANALWVLVCHHIVDSKDLVSTMEWHAEWWEIQLSGGQFLATLGNRVCAVFWVRLCLKAMRCEGDSADKVSSHILNFNVASGECDYQRRWNLSGILWELVWGCSLCGTGRGTTKEAWGMWDDVGWLLHKLQIFGNPSCLHPTNPLMASGDIWHLLAAKATVFSLSCWL